ncbi:MAG TPA: hypothetical protein VGL35_07540 [Rhizomicrobium sp.]|jgi:hypothetical protein
MSSPHQSKVTDSEKPAARQAEVAFADDARENIFDNLQQAQEKIIDAAAPVTEKARDFAEQQKQSSADRVDETATAVHRAADEIAKQSPVAGRYVHAGATQIERISRLLRENSLDELYRMTNRLAHDRPLAFIGGSVAAGFVLARVLRSSGTTSGRVS